MKKAITGGIIIFSFFSVAAQFSTAVPASIQNVQTLKRYADSLQASNSSKIKLLDSLTAVINITVAKDSIPH